MKLANVIKTSAAAATLAVSASAVAMPSGLITDWGYVNEAGFSSWTSTLGGTTGISASGMGDNTMTAAAGTATLLSWGVPTFLDGMTNGQSDLGVDSPQSGDIETNGMMAPGTPIFHDNWVVGPEEGNLASAVLVDALMLTPTAVDGVPVAFPALPAPTIEFFIEFFETPNSVDYGFDPYPNIQAGGGVVDTSVVCPNGEMNGSGVNVNGCGDIFVASASGDAVIEFDPMTNNILFSTSFDFGADPVLGGWEYTITTVFSGATPINDAACASVGQPMGCLGFITEEEAENELTVGFTIVAEYVSEPAPLAILGAGLIALGLVRRRVK